MPERKAQHRHSDPSVFAQLVISVIGRQEKMVHTQQGGKARLTTDFKFLSPAFLSKAKTGLFCRPCVQAAKSKRFRTWKIAERANAERT